MARGISPSLVPGGGATVVSETRRRSALKAITYRVICVISLLSVTLLMTGDVVESISITVVFQTLQTLLYYLHERAWALYWPA
ncbi:MAG: DUF2061 domain-containing protein [Thermoplasmata archaeon]|nr:DUF2061 domain-containing protein [Thermoplasmata archaeon]